MYQLYPLCREVFSCKDSTFSYGIYAKKVDKPATNVDFIDFFLKRHRHVA